MPTSDPQGSSYGSLASFTQGLMAMSWVLPEVNQRAPRRRRRGIHKAHASSGLLHFRLLLNRRVPHRRKIGNDKCAPSEGWYEQWVRVPPG